MRVVDTREYVSVLRDLTNEGREVSMLIAGGSMSPFLIHNRDTIWFRKPERPLRRGDMVFYERDDGRFVMHRIVRVRPEGYYMVGDAQTDIEGPLREDQIFARVFQVQRKGRILRPGDFWWEFFEKVWIRVIPLRGLISAMYGLVAGGRGKKSEEEA